MLKAILILMTIFTAIFYFGIFLSKKSCSETAKVMKKEYSYSIYTDCMIKVDDEMIPLQNYKTNRVL